MAVGTDQTLNAPVVLLTGASSQIGVFAVPRLVDAGFRVLAVSRGGRPERFAKFEQVHWLSEAEALERVNDCRFLISAGPIALVHKFLQPGTAFQCVVVFSSSSVASKQESPDPTERTQMQSMLADETQLWKTAKRYGFKLVILRPTLIYGCGLDTNISRLAAWIRRFGFMPLNGRAQGLRQPVHADDLAAIALTAMFSNKVLPRVLFLAGGDTLSYSDMVAKIFTAQAKPVRLLRLPEWLFVLLVSLANMLKTGAGLNGEMVRRQRHDLVFDDGKARELLGYNPRPFKPGMKDFSLPDG